MHNGFKKGRSKGDMEKIKPKLRVLLWENTIVIRGTIAALKRLFTALADTIRFNCMKWTTERYERSWTPSWRSGLLDDMFKYDCALWPPWASSQSKEGCICHNNHLVKASKAMSTSCSPVSWNWNPQAVFGVLQRGAILLVSFLEMTQDRSAWWRPIKVRWIVPLLVASCRTRHPSLNSDDLPDIEEWRMMSIPFGATLSHVGKRKVWLHKRLQLDKETPGIRQI